MELFKYNPTPYVATQQDLPIDFLQGQLEKSQGRYDTQVKALNETTDNFMKLNPGLYTRDEYDRIKNKYTTQIDKMTKDLTTYGDVKSIVPQYSKLVSDIAFDPGIKSLNQDYLAYQQHLKFMSENPNAIDISSEGPQYGPNQALELNRYRGIKPEDSLKPMRDLVAKFEPTQDIKTGKWTAVDPRDGSVITGNTIQEVKQLSEPRIAKAFEDYYPAWVANASGISEFDMRKLAGNDLSVYQDPNKGRELYNKLWQPFRQMAYTQTSQEQQNVSGGAAKTVKTDDGNGVKPVKPIEINTQSTTEQYGYDQIGTVYKDPINSRVNSPETSSVDIHNMQVDKEDLFTKASIAKGRGDVATEKALIAQWHILDEKQKMATAWKQNIEGDLYNKVNPETAKIGRAKANSYLQSEILNGYGTPEEAKKTFDDMYNNREKSYMYQAMKAKHTSPIGFSYTFDEYLEEIKKTSDKIYTENVPEAEELQKRWDAYLDFSTSGHSYIVGEDTRKEVDVIALSLFNSGKKPKDPLTDKEIGSFPEFQTQLFSHKKDGGSYAFDHFSYEILMDEKDGPVLIVTGINPTGKNNIVEYELKDTPNIRALLGKLAPNDVGINESFIEATKTMKDGNNRKGNFSIDRVGGTEDKHEFTKMPIGDGKFMYRDKETDGLFNDLNELIRFKHQNAFQEDAAHVTTVKALSSKIDAAIQSKDPAAIKAASDNYSTYILKHSQERKEASAVGKQGQFRQTPKTPLQ